MGIGLHPNPMSLFVPQPELDPVICAPCLHKVTISLFHPGSVFRVHLLKQPFNKMVILGEFMRMVTEDLGPSVIMVCGSVQRDLVFIDGTAGCVNRCLQPVLDFMQLPPPGEEVQQILGGCFGLLLFHDVRPPWIFTDLSTATSLYGIRIPWLLPGSRTPRNWRMGLLQRALSRTGNHDNQNRHAIQYKILDLESFGRRRHPGWIKLC